MLYYVPSPQVNLQQVQHGQPKLGLRNIKIPDVRHLTWPMPQPMKQQQRIHVSINKDWRNVAHQSLISVPTLCNNQYQQGSPLTETQQLSLRNIQHGAVTPTGSTDDDTLYRCNIISQLQGSYEIETFSGCIQVSVIVPQIADEEDQYAVVQRFSTNGNALAEQRIYDEPLWFALKSVDGILKGILRKGSNMKQSVVWQNPDSESSTVWRRKGEVTFNFVKVEPKVRRNSSSSIRTVSTSPQSVDTPVPAYEDVPMLSGSELAQVRGAAFLNRTSNERYSPFGSSQSSLTNLCLGIPSAKSDQQQEKMFQLIKAQCMQNPILFKKIVDWGVKNNPGSSVPEEKTKGLSEGRIWVIAHTSGADEDEAPAESIDDIKGAYQKDISGVYKQPDPEACGSGVQHRLLRDKYGRWMIEQHCADHKGWQVRAYQVNGARWVDLNNNKLNIRVYILPMSSIFERLDKQLMESKSKFQTRMDFLFTSCNQLKLCKLKGRNLKHHIANLKVKLEKRHALSLGVAVANAAEIIRQESEPSRFVCGNWF